MVVIILLSNLRFATANCRSEIIINGITPASGGARIHHAAHKKAAALFFEKKRNRNVQFWF